MQPTILSAKGQGNPPITNSFCVLFIELLLHILKLKKKWEKGHFMTIFNSEIIKELNEFTKHVENCAGLAALLFTA